MSKRPWSLHATLPSSQGVIADSAAVIIQNISTLALAYTLSLYYSWRVALVITAALPGLVLTGVFQAKFAMGFDRRPACDSVQLTALPPTPWPTSSELLLTVLPQTPVADVK